MNAFYQLMSTSAGYQDPYLRALQALSRVTPLQLTAMSSNLAWQVW